MHFRKKAIALLTAAALMLPMAAIPAAATDTPADWAQNAVWSLQAKQVLRQDCYGNYDAPITRGEFAYLGVRVYELLSGNSLQDKNVSLNNIFLDTNDEYVRKAFYAGIVQGYGGGMFGVWDGISREQIATLLVNAVEQAGNNLTPAGEQFADGWQISDWAAESVQKAYGAGILRGTGGGCVSPQEGATREQALVMVNNILSSAGLYAENRAPGNLTPILKWAYGGTQETWCPEAFYSTPTARDIDGDGCLDIVAASSTIFSLNAASGRLNFRAGARNDTYSASIPTDGRVWTDVVVRDIDGDGGTEIVAGYNNGVVAVYDAWGHFKPGWPQSPQTNPAIPYNEFRALKVADIDSDGQEEIIAGAAAERSDSLWVFEPNGSVKPGWPRLDAAHDGAAISGEVSDETKLGAAYAWGFFGNTLSVGNLTGNGVDIVAPSDVPFVCVYDGNGNLRPANSKWGGRTWGKVGFWEDPGMEDRNENEGWGLWPLESYPYHEMLTVNFAHAGSEIADLDGDGKNELIVTGNVYDTSVGHPPVLYTRVFVLNGDRTRWSNGVYDWRSVPTTIGKPLNEDYYQIEACMSSPLVDDIDSDGKKEIIVPASDGKMHCYGLDKAEKGNFPVSVYNGWIEEYASKPAAADLNGDGKKELVFTTWTRKDSGKTGSLYIVDAAGQVLQKRSLPFSLGSPNSNGCLAAPLLQDIDGDGKMEIILNTVYSGVVVYDI